MNQRVNELPLVVIFVYRTTNVSDDVGCSDLAIDRNDAFSLPLISMSFVKSALGFGERRSCRHRSYLGEAKPGRRRYSPITWCCKRFVERATSVACLLA